MNNLEALRQKEKKLHDLTFTQENSPLTKIDEDLSPIGGKSFSQWLGFFQKIVMDTVFLFWRLVEE